MKVQIPVTRLNFDGFRLRSLCLGVLAVATSIGSAQVTQEFFERQNLQFHVETLGCASFKLDRFYPQGLNSSKGYSARVASWFSPKQSGRYRFKLSISSGKGTVKLIDRRGRTELSLSNGSKTSKVNWIKQGNRFPLIVHLNLKSTTPGAALLVSMNGGKFRPLGYSELEAMIGHTPINITGYSSKNSVKIFWENNPDLRYQIFSSPGTIGVLRTPINKFSPKANRLRPPYPGSNLLTWNFHSLKCSFLSAVVRPVRVYPFGMIYANGSVALGLEVEKKLHPYDSGNALAIHKLGVVSETGPVERDSSFCSMPDGRWVVGPPYRIQTPKFRHIEGSRWERIPDGNEYMDITGMRELEASLERQFDADERAKAPR
jgi:hypothetical protein